jgi:hypothetical protein
MDQADCVLKNGFAALLDIQKQILTFSLFFRINFATNIHKIIKKITYSIMIFAIP